MIRAWPSSVVALALAAWLSTAVNAQEKHQALSFVEAYSELAELKAEVSDLRNKLNTTASAGYDGDGGVPIHEETCGRADCGACGCEPCCCCKPGLVGGVEFGYLKPHNGSGTGFQATSFALVGVAATLDLGFDVDFEETGRLWLGWDRGDSVGVRTRYWEFDHAFNQGFGAVGTLASINAFHNWDTYVWDFEGYSSHDCCDWDLTWSFGFRYLEYLEQRGFTAVVGGVPLIVATQKDFDGFGTTAAFEARRQLTTNLSFFGNARGSVLMGDDTNSVFVNVTIAGLTVATNIAQTEFNAVKSIFESQVGVEYTLPICGGGYYFARAGAEFQVWNDFGLSQTALVFDDTSGFGGFFAAAGFAR